MSYSLVGLVRALFLRLLRRQFLLVLKKSNFNLTTISFPKPDIVSYEAKNDLYQIPYDSYPLNPLP